MMIDAKKCHCDAVEVIRGMGTNMIPLSCDFGNFDNIGDNCVLKISRKIIIYSEVIIKGGNPVNCQT